MAASKGCVWTLGWAWAVLRALLLLWAAAGCLEAAAAPQPGVLEGNSVTSVSPSMLTQYVPAEVTVVLASSLCKGQLYTAPPVALRVYGAGPGSGDLFFNSSTLSSNCSALVFPLLWGAGSQPGRFSSKLFAGSSTDALSVPVTLVVQQPVLLSMAAPKLAVLPTNKQFPLWVNISRAASSAVTARLQLDRPGMATVSNPTLTWQAGEGSPKAFYLQLLGVAEASQLMATLQVLGGSPPAAAAPAAAAAGPVAVVAPAGGVTQVQVQSPVWRVQPGQGVYRSSKASQLQLQLHVDGAGSSSFPTTVAYQTVVLQGSRPVAPGCWFQPNISANSSSDDGSSSDSSTSSSSGSGGGSSSGSGSSSSGWSAPREGWEICTPGLRARAWNLSVSGSFTLQPGSQAQPPPIPLPLHWGRIPPEAELRLGVRLLPLGNARVNGSAAQGQLATIVFGTPLGVCPPGTSLRRRNSSANHADRPMYSDTAALQELQLMIGSSTSSGGIIATSSSGGALASPATGSSASSSSSSSRDGSGAAAAATSRAWSSDAIADAVDLNAGGLGNSSSSNSSSNSKRMQLLDLDPPFRPLQGDYVALLPRETRGASLLMASSRRGDKVYVDAGGCDYLTSKMWLVDWQEGLQHMWRGRFDLTGQDRPCWLRVFVFTQPHQDGSKQPQQGGGGGGAAAAAAAAAAPLASAGSGADGSSDGSSGSDNSTYSGSSDSSSGGAEDDSSDGSGSGSSSSSSSGGGSRNDAAAVAAAAALVELDGSSFVLYRSYTIRFIPLRPERQLSLRSISFSSVDTTVLACGIPSRFAHLFLAPPPANSTSSGGGGKQAGGGLPPPLVPRPNQKVAVGYISAAAAAGALAPSSSPSPSRGQGAANQQQQQQQGQQQQYMLRDPWNNATVLWSTFTPALCSPDHYVLVPLGQVHSSMRMVPELLDPAAEGIKISISEAMFALAGSNSSRSGGSGGGGSSSVGVPLGLAGGCSIWQQQQQRLNGSSSGSVAGGGRAACSTGTRVVGSVTSRMKLPGVTAELPVITTADEGRSSKTYTLLLYSNETAASAVQRVPVAVGIGEGAQAAAANSSSSNSSSSSSSSSSSEDDEAALEKAVFGQRPGWWPQSPAQNLNCSLCPNGTYSTKINAQDCQVCPPGKYAASPFSTSCSVCPLGTFSHYWGASACRACLPGTFAPSSSSVYCTICADGRTTSGEGAASCDVSVDGAGAAPSSDYAILLSFGVLLEGASLDSVSVATTGINGSSEGIVAVLVQGDTALALNVSLHQVDIVGVRQIGLRQLLVNVSATVPVNTEEQAAADTQELSADALVQRLIDDPNTFLRTTQTLGAESASITDVTAHNVHLQANQGPAHLHAVLWPSLFATLLVLVTLSCSCWHWHWSRKQRALQGRLALAGAATGVGQYSRGGPLHLHNQYPHFSSSSGSSSPGKSKSLWWGARLGAWDWRFKLRLECWGHGSGRSSSSSGGGGSEAGVIHQELAAVVGGPSSGAAAAAAAAEESYTARLRSKQALSVALPAATAGLRSGGYYGTTVLDGGCWGRHGMVL